MGSCFEATNLRAQELGPYLLNSFGSAVRLDYGTGHELSFLGFLAASSQILPYTDADLHSVGLLVMAKYLEIAQRLQSVYSLEPAGSHGVWGLDDYQFIPYIWGSSQLVGQSNIDPSAVTNPSTVFEYKHEYLYLQAIDQTTSVRMLAVHAALSPARSKKAVPLGNIPPSSTISQPSPPGLASIQAS